MKIVVFGATGGTGKNVVERALAAGHDVVAVARRPEAVTLKHERLRVHKAEAADADAIAQALQGADAAISAIGPSNNRKPGTIISDATRNIVQGCERNAVKRFVLESGIMVGDAEELSLVSRALISFFRAVVKELYLDKVKAEALVTASQLEWVIVRPPNLSHSPATGSYLAGPKAKVFPAKALSHADCADALLRAATQADWVHQIVNVGH